MTEMRVKKSFQVKCKVVFYLNGSLNYTSFDMQVLKARVKDCKECKGLR